MPKTLHKKLKGAAKKKGRSAKSLEKKTKKRLKKTFGGGGY